MRDVDFQIFTQPQDFFREVVTHSLSKLKVRVPPEIEFYLVNLLSRFVNTENLFTREKDGQFNLRPLALQIKDAMEESEAHHRMLLFRQVGDVSLYTAGYFCESLDRRAVDVDYYIDLGGVAYGQVASVSQEAPLRKMYTELADRFKTCVQVLQEVSEITLPKTEKDLLRLYERWQRTGSERAARSLQEAGILPIKTLKND